MHIRLYIGVLYCSVGCQSPLRTELEQMREQIQSLVTGRGQQLRQPIHTPAYTHTPYCIPLYCIHIPHTAYTHTPYCIHTYPILHTSYPILHTPIPHTAYLILHTHIPYTAYPHTAYTHTPYCTVHYKQ